MKVQRSRKFWKLDLHKHKWVIINCMVHKKKSFEFLRFPCVVSKLQLLFSCHMHHIKHIIIILHKIRLWSFSTLPYQHASKSGTHLGITPSSLNRPKTVCHKVLVISQWSIVYRFIIPRVVVPPYWLSWKATTIMRDHAL